MKKVLYIGWIGFNNLGDELLWNIFRDTSAKYINNEDITIVPSLPGIDLKNLEEFDTIVLGGGSLLLPGYLQILQNALNKGKSVAIWGSGLDWIEKHNLDLLINHQLSSLENNFKQKDVEVLEDVINRALFVGVRGPYTKKAIEIMIGKDKSNKVKIIGDPALLLDDTKLNKPQEREKVIGINWGTTFNRLYGANEQLVEEQLVEAAKHLLNKGYKLMIYTVWTDDIPHCERLYTKINNPDNVLLDKTLYTEQQLIEKLSGCVATINFKLHANLLSLTANVPAIALGYRFKVFDTLALLGLEKFVVSTDSKQLTNEILDRVEIIEKTNMNIMQQYHSIQQTCLPLLELLFTKDYL